MADASGAAGAAAAAAAEEKKGGQVAAVREVVVVDRPDGEQRFGDLKLVQSGYKTQRQLVELSDVSGARAGQVIWVRGRVATSRAKGKSCFLVLRRGFSTLQCVMFAGENTPKEMVTYAGKVPTESIVEIEGEVTKVSQPTKTSQSDVELQVRRFFVVSPSGLLPFQVEDAMRAEDGKDGPTVQQDTRLAFRWIDVRTPANHAIFRMQSAVCRHFRDFFLDRDFVEIHTPKITPGVSEGGANVFRLDYFGRPACLAQSPQLYKQMTAACSDLFRVFEIGPVFRAENSHTHRHLCEFTGLDFEMEIQEHYHELLKVLGDLFVYVFDKLNEKCAREQDAIRSQYASQPLRYLRETLVLSFPQAVAMLREAGVAAGDFEDLSTPQEKKLGELVAAKYNTDFYIVDKYPLAARPFYTMPDPEDPRYTNSYDVFLRGEEITSGAQRIHDVPLLKRRAAECGIPEDNIKDYTTSFGHGAPPHGGAGIGLERVVMLFMGLNNIRKTSFFPRDPLRCEP